MGNLVVNSNLDSNMNESFYKMSQFLHELAQPLLVIQAYVNGGSERNKQKNLTTEEIAFVFNKINEHINLISNQIRCMNQGLNLYEC